MKQKIAVDCSKLNTHEKTGTHRFLIGFLNELVKNKNYDYYFYYDSFNPELNNFNFLKKGKLVCLNRNYLYTQVGLLMELNKYDKFIFPWQTLPFLGIFSRCSKIAIIHDTGFSFKTKIFTFFTQLFADKLFAVSEFTASKLIRKSVVIPEGVDSETFYKIPLNDLVLKRKELNVPEYFILSLGRVEKRKNVYNNLVAFNLVQKFIPKLKYVFVGQLVEDEEKINSFIEALDIPRSSIVFKKYISDEDLNVYLNSMELMLFTPESEGFGLPVIEAYAVQKPVILSRIQPLAEISLSANQFVDFNNPKDIAEKTINFLKKNESIKSPKMFKNLLNQFSWERSASIFFKNL